MIKLPEEFRSRMKNMLGDEYEAYLESYEKPRAQSLRINTLKTSVPEFMNHSKFDLRPVPWTGNGFYYSENDRPGRHAFHDAGLYYIQEASAMVPGMLAGVRPGECVLDLCAAPGGKTTQIAAAMAGEGLLISNEINPARAKILSQNVERMGIRNCIVTNETPENLAAGFPSFFDRIIVDAPCSGEGMFKKEEQAAEMWSEENVENCALRQREILNSAASMLKSGGTLVYSTCTFAPEEDEESAALFLKEHPEFTLIDMPSIMRGRFDEWGFTKGRPEWCRDEIDIGDDCCCIEDEIKKQLTGTVRLFPHKLEGEGHFAAVFRKEGIPVPAGLHMNKTARGKAKQSTELLEAIKLFREFEQQFLTADIEKERVLYSASEFCMFGDELYLEPGGVPLKGLKVLRAGLHLGTIKKGRFEPSQALAQALSAEEVRQCHDIEDDTDVDTRDAAAYLKGESLSCDMKLKGWTLVTVSGYSVSFAKAANGILKNHYPKGLRRQY